MKKKNAQKTEHNINICSKQETRGIIIQIIFRELVKLPEFDHIMNWNSQISGKTDIKTNRGSPIVTYLILLDEWTVKQRKMPMIQK